MFIGKEEGIRAKQRKDESCRQYELNGENRGQKVLRKCSGWALKISRQILFCSLFMFRTAM